MSESHAVAYRALRSRVREVVESSDADVMLAVVPATPEWRAHDVLAHLVGVTDDVVNGRLDGLASDAVDPGSGRLARPSARPASCSPSGTRSDRSSRRCSRPRRPRSRARRCSTRPRTSTTSATRSACTRRTRQRCGRHRVAVDRRRADTRRRARDVLRGRSRRAAVGSWRPDGARRGEPVRAVPRDLGTAHGVGDRGLRLGPRARTHARARRRHLHPADGLARRVSAQKGWCTLSMISARARSAGYRRATTSRARAKNRERTNITRASRRDAVWLRSTTRRQRCS